jgi:hypothetical protein
MKTSIAMKMTVPVLIPGVKFNYAPGKGATSIYSSLLGCTQLLSPAT